ncbi:hypothetical protein AVEN_61568-1 [Araneus ventricosus]|uniref:RING-type domain-containing protein n=1 Tax=Araneus ventricosus TaxID=182803 RepID=A0A4Y2N487_ARAVE|nr:hypothetical protein AVEN_61568-1 [Araneus ventricosus]
MHTDGSSDVDLHQQKARTLVSKGAFYSNRLQRFNNCNGFELSVWMAKNGVLLASNFSEELQECHVETGYKTEQLEMAVVPLKNLLKVLESPKPTISDPCFPQMPLDIFAMNRQTSGIFALEVVQLQKFSNCNGLELSKWIAKNGVVPRTIFSEGLQERHAKTGSDPMKLLEICCWCQERISKKKFFDERRFALLRQCDCIICYGCIRKVTSTSGVVKGPVCCPSCFVESDTVAASARWIKGEEKLKFFETYSKSMGELGKYGQAFTPERTTLALYSKSMEQPSKYRDLHTRADDSCIL